MTTALSARSVPAGRAGRRWLHRRLDAASRGRAQLDRRLRVLLPEQRRLRTHADRCRRDWDRQYAQARQWQRRAALLSGQDGLRHATPTGAASFEIVWTTVMGLRIPSDVAPTPGTHDSASPLPPDNAAVTPARRAYTAALESAVRLAAAEEGLRRLDAEIATTRRRLRALEKHWIPWLTEALRLVEFSLDEAERDEGIRLRRAVAARGEEPS